MAKALSCQKTQCVSLFAEGILKPLAILDYSDTLVASPPSKATFP